MKKHLLTPSVVLLAVTAVGCGTTTDYASDDYTPTEAPIEVGMDDDGTYSEDITDLALVLAWDGMSYSEQEDICTGWALAPEVMLDAFVDGAGGTITRAEAADFIEGRC